MKVMKTISEDVFGVISKIFKSIANSTFNTYAQNDLKLFKDLENSFYCYCYALHHSPLRESEKYRAFISSLNETAKNERFSQVGCDLAENFDVQVLIWSVEISITLATMNSLYEVITVWLSNYYQFDNKTYQEIFRQTFFQYFYTFNNSICTLLLGIRVSENYQFLHRIFQGSFSDFTQAWYEVIGYQFVVNYVVNVIVWIVNYIVLYSINLCCKCGD